jgi:hypothetical protein
MGVTENKELIRNMWQKLPSADLTEGITPRYKFRHELKFPAQTR